MRKALKTLRYAFLYGEGDVMVGGGVMKDWWCASISQILTQHYKSTVYMRAPQTLQHFSH